MCDIYGHRCENPGCDQLIAWHIGDFLYKRDEFKIWCPTHWRSAPADAVVFWFLPPAEDEEFWGDSPEWDEELDWEAIAAVGPVGFMELCDMYGNNICDVYDNHPNTLRDWEMLTMGEAMEKARKARKVYRSFPNAGKMICDETRKERTYDDLPC